MIGPAEVAGSVWPAVRLVRVVLTSAGAVGVVGLKVDATALPSIDAEEPSTGG